MTNTKRVMSFLNKDPNLKVDIVMKLLNVRKPYAHNLLSVCRRRLEIVKGSDGVYRFKKMFKTNSLIVKCLKISFIILDFMLRTHR